MKTNILSLIIVFAAKASFAQVGLRQLMPIVGPIPDVSTHTQQEFERRYFLSGKANQTPSEKAELTRLYKKHDEMDESVWQVMSGGCSWYCAGGPFKVVASSTLGPQYAAAKIDDFSLQYAWVEGAVGDGIGESVTYYFKQNSPRLNEIKVYNGYVKTAALWRANNRVKKLKLWVNNRPYALLSLRDSPALQTFKVPLLGHRADKKDLMLRFEILEIYPGTTYHDTALTEIFFDGIDVH